MNNKNILLMEDDIVLGETLKELLENSNYMVDLADNGEIAVELSFDKHYDLYIFDINVPLIDGFELLSSLRDAGDLTPTIFISALIDIKTIVHGFALGAEDFIKKPFFPEELLLKIDVKLQKLNKTFTCKDIIYYPDTKELFKKDTRITLSHMLTDMFHLLITNQNQVISKDNLLDCMERPTSTALRVAITKLKNQTGLNIKNIRSVGYTLESC